LLAERHDWAAVSSSAGDAREAELELENQRGGQQDADHGYERVSSNDEQR
jgi:hypothetical protein